MTTARRKLSVVRHCSDSGVDVCKLVRNAIPALLLPVQWIVCRCNPISNEQLSTLKWFASDAFTILAASVEAGLRLCFSSPSTLAKA